MQPPDAPESLVCHRCGRVLTPGRGSFYVVRIEAFADPAPPEDLAGESAGDAADAYERLLESVAGMSEQELMDQVHRRLTLHLCGPCYRTWIDSPVG